LLIILVLNKLLDLILNDAHVDGCEGFDNTGNSIPKLSDIFWVQSEAFPNTLDARMFAYFLILVDKFPDIGDDTFATLRYMFQLFLLLLVGYVGLNVQYDNGKPSHSVYVLISINDMPPHSRENERRKSLTRRGEI
jgi:hypothetical protein